MKGWAWRELELPRCLVCGTTASGNMLEVEVDAKTALGQGHICYQCVKDIVAAYNQKYGVRIGQDEFKNQCSGFGKVENTETENIGLVTDLREPEKRTPRQLQCIRIFKDIVNFSDHKDFSEKYLMDMMMSNSLSKTEAQDTLIEALCQGYVYERKPGVYVKT